MTFICGNCGQEYSDFKGIFGCFVDHVNKGEEMKDFIEVPKSLLDKPTAEV